MADGQTLTFDLRDVGQASTWEQFSDNPKNQSDIRAIGVIHDKMWHVLPTPKKFKRISYQAWMSQRNGQPASLRVSCQADDINIKMVLYYPNGNSPRMVRTDIKRTGRQVYQAKKTSGGKQHAFN